MEILTTHGPLVLFYAVAAIAIVAAVCVVTLRNPMYGALSLLVSFLSVAVLFLLRHAEFLAVVQVFVYGGGIMVLFLFVIMLVNLHQLSETRRFTREAPFALLVAAALLAVFVVTFLLIDAPAGQPTPSAFMAVDGEAMGNSEAVAWVLYREYLLPFEIVSVFLLVAMIGAVVLGRKE